MPLEDVSLMQRYGAFEGGLVGVWLWFVSCRMKEFVGGD